MTSREKMAIEAARVRAVKAKVAGDIQGWQRALAEEADTLRRIYGEWPDNARAETPATLPGVGFASNL